MKNFSSVQNEKSDEKIGEEEKKCEREELLLPKNVPKKPTKSDVKLLVWIFD